MAEQSFRPLSSPQKVPAYSQNAKAMTTNIISTVLRDNFTISTWLLIGGLLQGVAVALLGYLTLLPAAVVITYRVGDNILMIWGWKKNRYLSGVFFNKFTAQVPRSDGSFGSTPAASSLVVFLIGSKCNHPLGAFDPVYRKVSDYFAAMVRELQADAEVSGLLGATPFIGNSEATANQAMSVMYFRDLESLHKYAHGPFHMKAVKYWGQIVKNTPHVSIYHETYVVPKGQWETIYGNSKPTGLSAAAFPVHPAQGNGETEWMSPNVDARHPSLRSAAGRIQSDYLKGYEEKHSEIWDKTFDVDYGDIAP
ncbi:hypothetical protein AJ78_05423 [Emergomyces pasteurianus Ep9510]|uniref:Uncharacterized protein n=1 Tax=Emergomyces pasteurianus Ep9510 TaxID=1447872 RepID=A0A1J9PCI0_9EURO|nr:hypothetical protein AJ78_05423 [Emergomyces pasteurianus Ep9510]